MQPTLTLPMSSDISLRGQSTRIRHAPPDCDYDSLVAKRIRLEKAGSSNSTHFKEPPEGSHRTGPSGTQNPLLAPKKRPSTEAALATKKRKTKITKAIPKDSAVEAEGNEDEALQGSPMSSGVERIPEVEDEPAMQADGVVEVVDDSEMSEDLEEETAEEE